MRVFIVLFWLISLPLAFGELWYSRGAACCVLAGTNGTFYVVSGGPGVTVSTYSLNSSSGSTSLISGTLTPAAAVLKGSQMVVAGANADGTGFVTSLGTGTSQFTPWNKALGTAGGGTSLSGIALDPDGGIWLTGATRDPNYPVTSDAYQKSGPTFSNLGTPTYAVLTKLSADGQTILYSTFLGDGASACVGGSRCIGVTGRTGPAGIVILADGAIAIAGTTTAPRFPVTPNALVPTLKSQYGNGFATIFEPGGTALRYSTFLGGTGFGVGMYGDTLSFITLESGGNILVAGETRSTDFPVTANALQGTLTGNFGNWFISRISPTGALLYSTYYGGKAGVTLRGMAEDPSGNIWLSGRTVVPGSSDFPLLPGSLNLGTDALVELDSTGTKALVTQLLPSGAADESLRVDSAGRPILTGSSGSILRLTPQGVSGTEILGIANAAGPALTSVIAPGEIMSLYGAGLATGDPVVAVVGANGKLPTALNNVSINIAGLPAPLLYVSPTQVNFIVPLGLSPTTIFPFLDFHQGSTIQNTITPSFALSQPEIVVAVNQDFTLNSKDNPAAANSTVVLYVFGAGAYQAKPAGDPDAGNPTDGAIAGSTMWSPVLNVTSNLGKVTYAGSAPGLALGVMQVNVQLTPLSPPPSYVLLHLQVGYSASNSVQVYLK